MGNLVLSRRAGEKIWVQNMLIKVDEINGKQVRLSFCAPASVNIAREEVLSAKELCDKREVLKRTIDY